MVLHLYLLDLLVMAKLLKTARTGQELERLEAAPIKGPPTRVDFDR